MNVFLKNIAVTWPSLLMGALIPVGVLLVLYFSKKRKETAFKAVLYGFATFFFVLAADVLMLVVCAQMFLPAIAVSDQSDATGYIYLVGSLALLFFFLGAEAARFFTFEGLKKQENNLFGGLTFGCGFILGQNLLIFGLVYFSEIDMNQSVGFGVLMLISAIIYLLISVIGYQLVLDNHRFVSPVIALSYYLMFAVMLIFANVYITYAFIAAVLIFNLVLGYILLPLPFKKGKESL